MFSFIMNNLIGGINLTTGVKYNLAWPETWRLKTKASFVGSEWPQQLHMSALHPTYWECPTPLNKADQPI